MQISVSHSIDNLYFPAIRLFTSCWSHGQRKDLGVSNRAVVQIYCLISLLSVVLLIYQASEAVSDKLIYHILWVFSKDNETKNVNTNLYSK